MKITNPDVKTPTTELIVVVGGSEVDDSPDASRFNILQGLPHVTSPRESLSSYASSENAVYVTDAELR